MQAFPREPQTQTTETTQNNSPWSTDFLRTRGFVAEACIPLLREPFLCWIASASERASVVLRRPYKRSLAAARRRTLVDDRRWVGGRTELGHPSPHVFALRVVVARPPTTPGTRRGEAAAVAGVVQSHVVQRPAGGAQRFCEVPHRREEQRDALFARPNVGRFFGHLGHPHRVSRGVEIIECGGVDVELVAEHDDEIARRRHDPGPRAARPYAFLAQALHQPLAVTCLPAKSEQLPAASPALPW